MYNMYTKSMLAIETCITTMMTYTVCSYTILYFIINIKRNNSVLLYNIIFILSVLVIEIL